MGRETEVVEALVDLASTLLDDYDVVELLTRLSDRCVSLLGVAAAGVMLASPAGELRLIASSSDAMRVVELFELEAREGPCVDAFRTGERVAHEDLPASRGRWPRFTPAAIDAGFCSAAAIPLRAQDRTIGAINLFGDTVEPISDEDMLVAQGFAALATLSILRYLEVLDARRLNDQLRAALDSRVLIEQAKGAVAERAGIQVSEAFDRLRTHARNNRLRLTDVAQAALDGTLDPGVWRRVDQDAGSGH